MKRVAVLRGGPSSEYEVSLRSGKAVLDALANLPYTHKDIIISKDGDWLEHGLVRTPDQVLEAVDVVVIALHGEFGEDGQVQRILKRKNIPFTGSGALASAIAYNKEITKQLLAPHGIKMPRHISLNQRELPYLGENLRYITELLGTELFVKPMSGGSSLGASLVKTPLHLLAIVRELLKENDSVIIEEYIAGREATVGVLHDFRGESLYVLPAVEIVPPPSASHFSYEDKYSGQTQELCPGRFTYEEKTALTELAALIHTTLACEHYSRSDFLLKDGDVYFLEINTLPGLTSESLFPKAAAAVGLEFDDLIKHLIETAKA